jgi:cobalamin biosynthesis protein CobD/CbiB
MDFIQDLLKDPEKTAILISALAVLLDLILGKIPDKLLPYVGIIRRIAEAYLKRKETNKN